jgi:hypothetical protein
MDNNNKKYLGKGRSGVVFLQTSSQGKLMATKIFSGEDSLAKLANYIFYGAPNAYSWSEDAVRCAHLRRKILEKLLPYWFNDQLRIASSYGTAWNAEMNAFEIQTEFIKGRHVSLHHPYSKAGGVELKNLVNNLTVPLQEKLNESGFDGLVWQAGLGNPTAISNFMLHDDGKWVWIDAESGVPALFPLNPIALIKFYIPKTFQYGAPLFDDVNVRKLRSYLEVHKTRFCDHVGHAGYPSVMADIDQLEKHQDAWKGMSRTRKGISSQLQFKKINQRQADLYFRHPYLWYPRELGRVIISMFRLLFYVLPIKVFNRFKLFPYAALFGNAYGFVFSNQRRKKIIENYVFGRIASWKRRQQLSEEHATLLSDQLAHESSTPYFTDFMVVIALKPVVKAVQIFGLPGLYAMGLIGEIALGTGIAFGGSIYRTLYTLIRMAFEMLKPPGSRLPRTIALLVGVLPTVGSGGYAVQIIFSAAHSSKQLAEFIIYDMSSVVGEKIPIWGGKDTRTEHFFNHLPDITLRKAPTIQPVQSPVQ